MQHYDIGIDLGGTTVKAGVLDKDGVILSNVHLPCPRMQGDEAILRAIEDTVRLAVTTAGVAMEQIDTIGIGTPGIANCRTGVVEYSCNLGFENTPLGEELTRRLAKPVYVENDANVAALGEFYVGAGRGAESLVAITLGTGIGGGVVMHNRLIQGFNFAGTELGHTVITQEGEPCGCGRRGCWEAYAAATALIRQTRNAMTANPDSLMWSICKGNLDAVDGRTSFAAMEQGDEVATEVVRRYCRYVAVGLVNMVNIFQPEVICLGGGVSNAGEALLDPVRKVLALEDYARNSPRRCRLVRAELGNDAGIIGAAMLHKLR